MNVYVCVDINKKAVKQHKNIETEVFGVCHLPGYHQHHGTIYPISSSMGLEVKIEGLILWSNLRRI